jgi:hypothetical protein
VTPKQRELLDELRRRQNREAASLTPGQRFAALLDMRAFASCRPTWKTGRGLDETPELWLALLAKWRRLPRTDAK